MVGGRGRAALAFVADLVLVAVFVVIGRSSHGEDPVGGMLATFWPFLGGLVIGWIIVVRGHDPLAIRWSGILVWFFTVAVGILLRVSSGVSAAPSFIVVTAIVLGVFLIGWRAIAALVRRIRRRRSAPPAAAEEPSDPS